MSPSASASAFFAATQLCERVVTEIASCRQVGDKVALGYDTDRVFKETSSPALYLYVSRRVRARDGAGRDGQEEGSDLKLLDHDDKDAYKFALGGRKVELDVVTGECTNCKALELLLQGKPLVVKKTKQGKKRSRQ